MNLDIRTLRNMASLDLTGNGKIVNVRARENVLHEHDQLLDKSHQFEAEPPTARIPPPVDKP